MEDVPCSEPVWFQTLTPVQQETLAVLGQDEIDVAPDVLVIGGGLVGLAIAYFSAEQGARVQLIDRGPLIRGASSANFGGIWPNDQGPAHPPEFLELAFASRDLWPRLAVRPGFDFDWRVNGFLNVNAERFMPSAPVVAARLQEQGSTVTAVDEEQIAQLEPQLKRGLTGGLHYPSEAQLNPLKAGIAFAAGARQKRARLTAGVKAVSVVRNQGRITAVQTDRGTISAGRVVVATGAAVTWLVDGTERPLFPEGLPLRPVSGQMISTNPLPQLLKSTVAGQFLVTQLRSGEVVTGGTVTEGDSLTPDSNVSRQLVAAARDLIPALAGIPFTRAWCGIRPGSLDGLPILDRHPNAENLWLACGHFRNGVLLAPITGKLISEWMLQGTPSLDLAGFACTRFARTS